MIIHPHTYELATRAPPESSAGVRADDIFRSRRQWPAEYSCIQNKSRQSQLESQRPPKSGAARVLTQWCNLVLTVLWLFEILVSSWKPLRDAIRCHRSLYEEAGILHCDVSINNILKHLGAVTGFSSTSITPSNSSSCESSRLVWLELSHSLRSSSCSKHLPVHHTFESFFYVLVWSCTEDSYVTLN